MAAICKATVNAVGGLNARREPTKDSEIASVLKDGREIEVLESRDGWLRTEHGWSMECYFCNFKYPHPIPQAELAEESAEEAQDAGLDGMTVAQLRELAETRGLKVSSKARKPELVALLSDD